MTDLWMYLEFITIAPIGIEHALEAATYFSSLVPTAREVVASIHLSLIFSSLPMFHFHYFFKDVLEASQAPIYYRLPFSFYPLLRRPAGPYFLHIPKYPNELSPSLHPLVVVDVSIVNA